MIIFPIYVKRECKNKRHHESLPIYTFKSKETNKATLMSQFGYCPLAWVNHNKTLNNRINSLHETAFRLVYNDFKSLFQQLLEKDNSITIHQHNLQTLELEIFKVHNDIAPEVMKDVFEIKNHQYNY